MELLILKICLEGDLSAALKLIHASPREKVLASYLAEARYKIGSHRVSMRELFSINHYDYYLENMSPYEFFCLTEIIL